MELREWMGLKREALVSENVRGKLGMGMNGNDWVWGTTCRKINALRFLVPLNNQRGK